MAEPEPQTQRSSARLKRHADKHKQFLRSVLHDDEHDPEGYKAKRQRKAHTRQRRQQALAAINIPPEGEAEAAAVTAVCPDVLPAVAALMQGLPLPCPLEASVRGGPVRLPGGVHFYLPCRSMAPVVEQDKFQLPGGLYAELAGVPLSPTTPRRELPVLLKILAPAAALDPAVVAAAEAAEVVAAAAAAAAAEPAPPRPSRLAAAAAAAEVGLGDGSTIGQLPPQAAAGGDAGEDDVMPRDQGRGSEQPQDAATAAAAAAAAGGVAAAAAGGVAGGSESGACQALAGHTDPAAVGVGAPAGDAAVTQPVAAEQPPAADHAPPAAAAAGMTAAAERGPATGEGVLPAASRASGVAAGAAPTPHTPPGCCLPGRWVLVGAVGAPLRFTWTWRHEGADRNLHLTPGRALRGLAPWAGWSLLRAQAVAPSTIVLHILPPWAFTAAGAGATGAAGVEAADANQGAAAAEAHLAGDQAATGDAAGAAGAAGYDETEQQDLEALDEQEAEAAAEAMTAMAAAAAAAGTSTGQGLQQQVAYSPAGAAGSYSSAPPTSSSDTSSWEEPGLLAGLRSGRAGQQLQAAAGAHAQQVEDALEELLHVVSAAAGGAGAAVGAAAAGDGAGSQLRGGYGREAAAVAGEVAPYPAGLAGHEGGGHAALGTLDTHNQQQQQQQESPAPAVHVVGHAHSPPGPAAAVCPAAAAPAVARPYVSDGPLVIDLMDSEDD